MSIFTLIYAVIILPLQLCFEVVFSFAQRFTDNPGLSIIILSLTVNFLVLPLYARADALQAEQRNTELRLKPGIDHIKKVFSGDEKMMILQTYYRQNGYRPTDVIRESLSLILQIPFFIAAYRFLSDLAVLNGAAFGPIKDLGVQDGLITIGGVSVNLLPFLMTVINIISSIIYTKGFPLKGKIQLYVTALVFLVLLYPSPSGLVFYWTLNNLFSLVKNIFFKLKDPHRVLRNLASIVGVALIVYGVFFFDNTLKRKAVVVVIGLVLQIPLIIKMHIFSALKSKLSVVKLPATDKKLFVLSGILLAVLVGGLIPSAVIKASPQEFIDSVIYQNPVWYVVYSTCAAVGIFVVWFGVFYRISDNTGKAIIEKILVAFCGVSVVDYLFFGTDLGVLSAQLQFDEEPVFSGREILINSMIVFIIAVILCYISLKYRKFLSGLFVTSIITVVVMSVLNIGYIQSEVRKSIGLLNQGVRYDHFSLSREGNNVVVIMLDRAVGAFIPYIMNEKPELEDKFDGFTYYSNAVSFGGSTNFGAPALYGGYEYTPAEINKRKNELLKDKHDESLKVMPVLFNDNGFEVTVCDPSYAGYSWIPDLSIYTDHPDINTFNTNGMFSDKQHQNIIINNKRNFIMYGIMKTSPVFLQKYIYNGGQYDHMKGRYEMSSVQVMEGTSKATGMRSTFMDSFQVLENLDSLTMISNGNENTFLMIENDSTHEPCLLQEPEYEPAENVDNEEYDARHKDRFTVDGKEMKMESDLHYSHYHVNIASLIQLGKWFDYLRENGVYDNTRIILVSDHGRSLEQFDEFMINKDGFEEDLERYNCLLMVKDFNKHGFNVSDDFMTNGDVPSIAVSDLITDPVNPFTGKIIDDSEKKAHDQYVICSVDWDITMNNGYQFNPSEWLTVRDDLWNSDNWNLVIRNAVFTGENY